MSDILAKTIVELVENDDWNWFENRNGGSSKLRRIDMNVREKGGTMPYNMFTMHFAGKMGYWLRGGFWLTWDDFLKGITSILNQMGFMIISKEAYEDALINAFCGRPPKKEDDNG